MQKDDTVWHLMSICMWTGLACLGWLKQCRSNLGARTSERSPKPGQASRPQQNPAKGKAVPPEAGKNTARTTQQKLVPACSGHPQHLGTPWHFHTLLCTRLSLADAGKTSPARAGERPTSRLVRLIFLHQALHEPQLPSMRWAPPAQ